MLDQIRPVVALFQGYDSFTGSSKPNTCIKGEFRSAGNTSELYWKICENAESTLVYLGVSAASTLSAGKTSEETTKADFVGKLNLTTHTVSVVIRSTNVTEDLVADTSDLREGHPSVGITPQQFIASYGDSYVSEITKGAEYIGVLNFYTQTEGDKETLLASLQNKGVVPGGGKDGPTAANAFALNLKTMHSASTVHTEIHQLILGINTPVYPDADPTQMVAFARSFASVASQDTRNAVTLKYSLTGYEEVDGLRVNLSGIAKFREFFEEGDSSRNFAPIVQLRAQLRAAQNQVLFVKAVYDSYGYRGDTAVDWTQEGKAKTIWDRLKLISNKIDERKTNPSVQIEKFAVDVPQVPALKFTLRETVLSYGTGGVAQGVSDVTVKSITGRQVVRSVKILTNNWVDKMFVTYARPAGSQMSVKTVEYGGDGGKDTTEIILEDNEHINGAKGWSGGWQDGFRLHTSLSHEITAPAIDQERFKKEERFNASHMKEWNATADERLAGFSFKSTSWMDAITVISVKFEPAAWGIPGLPAKRVAKNASRSLRYRSAEMAEIA